ncbi:MAG: copper homeostasis protein CutC [Bacteroidales bacterium]|nr:copper homeostasis protein CutC [Bacteroidales bacterium]
MALLEVCCGNPESVDAAVLGGARRIELCADLEADGLTPPVAWIRDTKARYPALTVHVLIRPRAGDFVYSPAEADVMASQVEEALEAGADGIVIGALTPEGDVDVPLMERLVLLVESFNLATELQRSDLCHAANDSHFLPGPARRVSITFHRAFDRCRRPFEALEQIIGLGCDRILTSGQAATAEAGAAMLGELRRRARGRIGILPGGGVTPGNAAGILAATGCTEIHASASMILEGNKVTDAGRVADILQEIDG